MTVQLSEVEAYMDDANNSVRRVNEMDHLHGALYAMRIGMSQLSCVCIPLAPAAA